MKIKVFLLLIVLSLQPVILAEDDKIKKTDQQISAIVDNLGAENFEEREKAQSELIVLGHEMPDLAMQAYLRNYNATKDPEKRYRLKNIVRTLAISRYFQPKGFIGISMQQSMKPERMGEDLILPIEIVTVMPGFPAEKHGFAVGDQILKVDGKNCNERFNSAEVSKYIAGKKPGTTVSFLLLSNGNQVPKDVVIAERPSLPDEPSIEDQQNDFFQNWFKKILMSAEKKSANPPSR